MPDVKVRCGYCGGDIPNVATMTADSDRCPCGRRAVTRLGMGVALTHAEGCSGTDSCSCWEGTAIPRPQRVAFLDEMRLCKGGIAPGDRLRF